VNDAPSTVDDAAITAEDSPVGIAVLTNDSDLDGDTLVVSGVSLPAHGTATANADGTITYTPAADYNGPDSFTYTIADQHGGVATGQVNVSIGPANDPPAPGNDAATTAEDTAVTIAILANDSDVDGDSIAVIGVGAAAHGSATLNPDGTITYVPAADYHGSDSFTYQAGDGHGGEATATVTVAITAVPDAPVAQTDAYTTSEDVPLTVGGAGVLANDTDPDGGQLTAVLVASPAHGTLSLEPNGQFLYTPAADASGIETFSYKAANGTTESEIVVVTIQIVPVNDTPTADPKSVIVRFQTATPITVQGHDVDDDALTFRVVDAPLHGVISGMAPNLVYTPVTGFAGADTFSFVANDGSADSSAATVTLQVKTLSRPPEAEDQWMLLDEDTSVEITLNAGDPDGDELTFTIVSPPQHGTLTGSGANLIYTPDPDYSGDDRFTFRVSDGMSDSNDASVDLWVWSVNDSPVVEDLILTGTSGESVNGQLVATDREEDWVFFWLMSEPSNGTVTLDPMTGAFTYEPGPGSSGFDSFTYTVYDWQSQGTVATVYIVPASMPPGGSPPPPPPPADQPDRNR
jgi:VCBS repeat-containing protein